VEEIDHLLAGPVLGVHAGVYDQADGAPDAALKPAIVADGVLVEADLFAEALGVERPVVSMASRRRRKAWRRASASLMARGEMSESWSL